MSNQKESRHAFVDHRAWLHPNALSLMLGGCRFPMMTANKEMCSLLYTAEEDPDHKHAASKTWRIAAQFHMRPPRDYVTASEKAYIFQNLSTEQKNYVLHTINTSHVRSLVYASPKIAHKAVGQLSASVFQNNFSDIQGTHKLLPPMFMTTKQTFFPIHEIEKEERDFETVMERRADYFEVNPLIHKVRHMQENTWDTIYPSVSDGPFYPTQFVAFKHWGVVGKDEVFLKDRMVQRYQDDPQSFRNNDFMMPQDVWMIMAVQPYNFKYLSCAADMRSARTMLKHLEAEFISPYFREDKRMREVEDIMALVPESDPSHYSNFDSDIVRDYNRIQNMARISLG